MDYSSLNHLPTEVKALIVTGQVLVDEANATLADRYNNFDLTSKKQLKSDCRRVEKCIDVLAKKKVTDKNIKALENAITALRTSHTGLVAFFSR